MFNNIGGKIKVFVITVTILAIISCVVCGLAVIAYAIFGENIMGALSAVGLDEPVLNLAGGYEGAFGIIIGLVMMIFGSLAAWLLAFIPYGLGQLIQNTDRIARGIDGIRAGLSKNASQNSAPAYNAYNMNAYGNPVYNQGNAAYYGQQRVNNTPVTNAAADNAGIGGNAAKSFESVDSDKTINVHSAPEFKSDTTKTSVKSPAEKDFSKAAEEIFDAIEGKTSASEKENIDIDATVATRKTSNAEQAAEVLAEADKK